MVLYSNYFWWEADEDHLSLFISTGCQGSFFAPAVLSILPGKKDLTEKVCSRGRQALADRPPLKILMTILSLVLARPKGWVAERGRAF